MSDTGLDSIPPIIYELSNLRALSLSFNKVTRVDQRINQLVKLRYLQIDNNSLEVIPPINLRNLEILILEFNNLKEPPFPSFLLNLPSIKEVSLKNAFFDFTDFNINTLKINDNFYRLSLCKKCYTEEERQKIKQLLPFYVSFN